MVIREVPDPEPGPREVLIRTRAVGLCATDIHIFRGFSNYLMDGEGRPLPLRSHPLILGHEYCGEVVEVSSEVHSLRVGDAVVCDQGRNCHSQGRWPLCSYCASGDSHQCLFYQEHGITGPPGALAEYIAMPEVNCLPIPAGSPAEEAALVEPLGCVLHCSERAERASQRFTFCGAELIRSVLICGSGPAGLLFLQYLRAVRQFDGLIIVSDVRDRALDLARAFGATPINPARENLVEVVHELTAGQRVQYFVEATGNATVFELIPSVLQKQGTVLIYGNGHKGGDFRLLSNILFLEPTIIAAVGASGGFSVDGRPLTYQRSLELISSGKIQVRPLISHFYRALDEIPSALERDSCREDYLKGVLKLA